MSVSCRSVSGKLCQKRVNKCEDSGKDEHKHEDESYSCKSRQESSLLRGVAVPEGIHENRIKTVN